MQLLLNLSVTVGRLVFVLKVLSTQRNEIEELERTVSTQARELTRARMACEQAIKQRDVARDEVHATSCLRTDCFWLHYVGLLCEC